MFCLGIVCLEYYITPQVNIMYFSYDRRRMDHWSLFSKCNQAAAWKTALQGFLGGSVVKNSPANTGDTGLIPDPGRSHMHLRSHISNQDLTCCGTTKPMNHNYSVCVMEPGNCNYWAHVPQLLKPVCPRAHALQLEKPLQWEAYVPWLESSPDLLQLEKRSCSKEDLAQPKINEYIKLFFKIDGKWLFLNPLIHCFCTFRLGSTCS